MKYYNTPLDSRRIFKVKKDLKGIREVKYEYEGEATDCGLPYYKEQCEACKGRVLCIKKQD